MGEKKKQKKQQEKQREIWLADNEPYGGKYPLVFRTEIEANKWLVEEAPLNGWYSRFIEAPKEKK